MSFHQVHFSFDNIFIFSVQQTVVALAEIMDHVRVHHSNDTLEWNNVIKVLNAILTRKDMRRLFVQGDEHYARPDFEIEDCDVFLIWKALFVGVETYHAIMRGVSSTYPHIMVDSRLVFRDHAKEGDWDKEADVVLGHPFYLMAEMWDAYFEYLHLHPEQMEVFCREFQVCTGIIFFFMVRMVLVSLSMMLKTYYRLQVEQGGAPGVY